MRIEKDNEINTIILNDIKNSKKLNIHVNIDGNLDFHIDLRCFNQRKNKDDSCFIVDGRDNYEAYFATAKLFDSLLTEYEANKDFYKKRYSDLPLYNEKYECFKFYNATKEFDKQNFIRFFRHKGVYYIYFNNKSNEFDLSNLNTRYQEFGKYFNKYYCDLEQAYRNTKISSNNQVAFMNPMYFYKNNKLGDK